MDCQYGCILSRSSRGPLGGCSGVFCGSSVAPKKKHLIEAAPFGHLDQMLRTTVQGGQRPPAKTEFFFENKIKSDIYRKIPLEFEFNFVYLEFEVQFLFQKSIDRILDRSHRDIATPQLIESTVSWKITNFQNSNSIVFEFEF